MDNPIEIHVDWGDDFQQNVDVFIMTRDMDFHAHRVMIAELPETVGEVFTYRPAVASMTRKSCQWLMDRLWGMGFRPANDATPGQLKAMQDHLDDLRMQNHSMLEVILGYFRKRG